MSKKIPLCFIAGPFRADTPWQVAENIRAAERVGLEVAKLGGFPIIPHANSHLFLGQFSEEDFWLPGYQELLDRCDCLVLIPGWEASAGVKAERLRMIDGGGGEQIFSWPLERDLLATRIRRFTNGKG